MNNFEISNNGITKFKETYIKLDSYNVSLSEKKVKDKTNTSFPKHINYISETLYSMTDICYVFNIEIKKIIEVIRNNNIACLYDTKNNLYVDSKNMCKLFALINAKESINNQEFNNFLYCIERNAFGEDQYNRINKRIFLNM